MTNERPQLVGPHERIASCGCTSFRDSKPGAVIEAWSTRMCPYHLDRFTLKRGAKIPPVRRDDK